MRVPPTENMERVFGRVIGECRKALEEQDVSAQELLAILSQVVGGCIAWQDQRKMTVEMAMAVVSANIEIGNARARRLVEGEPQGNA